MTTSGVVEGKVKHVSVGVENSTAYRSLGSHQGEWHKMYRIPDLAVDSSVDGGRSFAVPTGLRAGWIAPCSHGQ